MRRVVTLLAAAGLVIVPCSGQSLVDQASFESGQLGGGLRLLGVTVFSGYSTSAYPQAGLVPPASSLNGLGGDAQYGATFSMGWQKHGLSGDLSLLYSGTYDRMAHYTNLNGYNQTLTLAAAQKLGQRWTFTLSGVGSDLTMAQYLFQPSPQNVVTQVPTSFDDFAAAVGAGQYSNTQAAALLTGSPILQAPARSLLLANRVLSYSAQAGLRYDVSSRLQLHFTSFAASGQSLLAGQGETAPVNYLMPRTLGADAGMGLTYSIDPLTQVGIDLSENSTFNHFEKVYTSVATVSLGRKIGTHWALNVHGGGTYNVVTQQLVASPLGRQIVGGGSLGFRTGSQSFLGSYERDGSDGYGVAVGTVTTTSGSWNWRQPGSRWGLFASFGQQQTRNTGFASLSGWQGSGGLTLALDPHTTMTAQYVYLNSAGTYLGTYSSIAVQSVRLSFAWLPRSLQQ